MHSYVEQLRSAVLVRGAQAFIVATGLAFLKDFGEILVGLNYRLATLTPKLPFTFL